MAKVGTGAITLTDVKDGIQPIVMQLSNESHAFVADQNGTIDDIERASFECLTTLWVGDEEASYTTTELTTTNAVDNKMKYNIILTSTRPTTWIPAKEQNVNKCKITMAAVPGGTTAEAKSAAIIVEVVAVNAIGRIVTGQLTISLTKGIQGVDGVAIRLEPNKLYFMADGDNNLVVDQPDVIIKPKIIGDVGTLTAYYKKDGSAETQLDFVQADADEDGYNDTDIVITKEMFGTADTYSVIVRGTASTTANDVITIARVKQGSAGEAALSVFITSSQNGTVFKNGSMDTHKKTLTAEVYDMATGDQVVSVDGGVQVRYLWYFDGAVATVDSEGYLLTDGSGENATGPFIIVGSEDITDGGSNNISCNITVED